MWADCMALATIDCARPNGEQALMFNGTEPSASHGSTWPYLAEWSTRSAHDPTSAISCIAASPRPCTC